MTEVDWLACASPTPLLEHPTKRGTPRVLRLVAVACCRRVAHLFVEPAVRRVVAVSEALADGRATDEELRRAHAAAFAGQPVAWAGFAEQPAADAVRWVGPELWPVGVATSAADAAADLAREELARQNRRHPRRPLVEHLAEEEATSRAAHAAEERFQARLLRDVLGNPFRPPGVIAPGPVARGLAAAAYEESSFEALPILADALEDAGVEDTELLEHLRGPGPHVRGCWAVDLVLGLS